MSAPASFFLATLFAFAHTDMASITLSLAAQHGKFHLPATFAGCFVGSAAADLAWFSVGRYLGAWALERPPLSWFNRRGQVELASRWLSQRGEYLLLLGRFMPALCTPMQFAAGMLHARPWRAVALLLASGAAHTTVVFGLAWWVGREIEAYFAAYQRAVLWGLVLAAAALLVLLRVVPWIVTRLSALGVSSSSPNAESPERTP